MTPLGFAVLELTVWWASQKPRPGHQPTLHKAGMLMRRWGWWFDDSQLGALDDAARELTASDTLGKHRG